MDRQASIDLGAISGNVAALTESVRGSQVMAVVKADGYGHGMVPAARAALAGGARWLGVVDTVEALALRQAGITAPVLCLMSFGEPDEAIAQGVDLSAGSVAFVAKVAAAAIRADRPARLHLKADTGLSRGGATPRDWPDLVGAALDAQARDLLRVVGVWSHFACADLPGHPSIKAQLTAFTDAVAVAETAGDELARPAGHGQAGSSRHGRFLRPPVRHGPRDHPRSGAARLRRWGAARRGRPVAGQRARAPLADRGHGLHGPVRGRLRRRAGRGGR